MPWVKILNRKSHLFGNKEKVHGFSLELILIASFIVIVLFLLAVSIKYPINKDRSGVNTPIQQQGERNSHSFVLPPNSIDLNC